MISHVLSNVKATIHDIAHLARELRKLVHSAVRRYRSVIAVCSYLHFDLFEPGTRIHEPTSMSARARWKLIASEASKVLRQLT
jgi:hypothetical protein